MSHSFLTYRPVDGFIHDWLVAGPLAIEVPNLERFTGPEWKLEIARHYYQAGSGVTQQPVERSPFETEDSGMLWEWVRCQDDHFVERTAFYHTTHYLRSWAYAQVHVQEAQQGQWRLTTNGPADVWVNGEHVHRQAHFHHQIPHTDSFTAELRQGVNDILVRFEEVAARECPYAMALHIAGLDEGAEIRLPTTLEPIKTRQLLGEALAEAYLERDVFKRRDVITVCWPETLKKTFIAIRMQTQEGRIYAEASVDTSTEKPIRLGAAHQYPDTHFDAMVMPPPITYHEQGMRIRRPLPVTMFPARTYSTAPYGTYTARRKEALEHAAAQKGDVFAEIAKMETNHWADLDVDLILDTIDGINRRKDCSDFYLVGLLGVMYRYRDKFTFPTALEQPLQDCVLNFKYWDDEPGSDAMCYRSENHQILFHTCEILAGQLYPDEVFSNAGQTGRWHREKGEKLALAWLYERGTAGFEEWDSNCYFEEDLLALSHLADLAETEQVWQMATVVMDKLFLTIGLNSFKGVFGSTHGRTYTRHIKGAYLEATSGITRLMWGMGIYNDRLLGLVSMACNKQYELPLPIAAIALDTPDELWNREQHPGVNKVTYRTPDTMLCSAQDYRPGQPGYQQHIWQATMSPEAVVFVTHPPCCSEEGSHRPNFWHGNVVLPRVAQWKDVLIDVRNLPPDDWLGFTHAYFPTFAFAEHTLRDGWAFARVGGKDGTPGGYLAVTAARGIELVKRGANANRELRSYAAADDGRNVWLCMMGRAAIDGTFEDFVAKILALDITFDGASVTCQTLRGDTLQFGWQGPFLCNGQELPLSGYKHYENPYCVADYPAETIDIAYQESLMRLHFERE